MKNRILYILILMMAFSLADCSRPEPKETGTETIVGPVPDQENDLLKISKVRFDNEGLSLTQIVQHNFGSKITSTGVLDVPPNGRAVISAQIGGYIKSSPLLVGDHVEKGQLLVRIENIAFIELQQEYLEAKEQLVFLKSDYERQKELFNEQITSEKSYLKAQSDYQQTLANSKGLRKKLQLLNIDPELVASGTLSSVARIYAPISGDITEISVKTGSHVSPEEQIMEIVNTDHMHLELKVFVQDVLNIKKGQVVYFKLPETHTKTFKGEVHLIGKSIQADRTIQIHAHIDDSESEGFVPGMYVQATILTESVSSIAIHEDAIKTIEDKSYVYSLVSEDPSDYVFRKVKVTTGQKDQNLIMVKTDESLDIEARFLEVPSGFSNYF